MPANGLFCVPDGEIEVATRFGLRAAIPRALGWHGTMTSLQLTNVLYWGRSPNNHTSQQATTRRAIARLKRGGAVKIPGQRGGRLAYAVDRRGLAR